MRNVDEEVLRLIAMKRDWMAKYNIAVTLARNPKCPVGVVLPLINRLTLRDLKGLKDDKGVSEAVRSHGPEAVPCSEATKVLNEGQLLRSARSRSLRLRAGDPRPLPQARARAPSRPLQRARQGRGRAEVPDAHRGGQRPDQPGAPQAARRRDRLAGARAGGAADFAQIAKAYLAKGVKAYKEGDFRGAYENFDMAAKHNPQDAQGVSLPRPRRRRASRRMPRQAVQAIETAVQREPVNRRLSQGRRD